MKPFPQALRRPEIKFFLKASLVFFILLGCTSQRSERRRVSPESPSLSESISDQEQTEHKFLLPEKSWPHLDKMKEASRKLPKTQKRAILLTTGAMNPIHLGHVNMVKLAKEYLEKKRGYKVLGAYVSPSHDNYVVNSKCRSKSGRLCERAPVRFDLVKEAVKDDPWIHAGAFEVNYLSKGTYDPDYPKVLRAFSETVNPLGSSDEQIDIFYVCGADHSYNLGGGNPFNMGLPKVSAVVIPREGDKGVDDSGHQIFNTGKLDTQYGGYSSSDVAEALKERDNPEWEKFLHPNVIKKIKEFGLYQFDFSNLPSQWNKKDYLQKD